jgi:hypothetical protein
MDILGKVLGIHSRFASNCGPVSEYNRSPEGP